MNTSPVYFDTLKVGTQSIPFIEKPENCYSRLVKSLFENNKQFERAGLIFSEQRFQISEELWKKALKEKYENDPIQVVGRGAVSEYIPILDELDMHVLYSQNICLANNIINDTNRDIDQILQKKTQSDHDIKEVAKKRKTIQDLKEKIRFLSDHLLPYENQIEIFRVESEMRESLERDFPEKQKFQEIYDQRVLPLLAKMKHLLIQNSNQVTFQAAAAKGSALQAGLRVISEFTEKDPQCISNSKISRQEVFLLPGQNAVFKQMNERAEEEERIANSLLDLMSEEAYVGTFNIKTATRGNFGIQAPEEVRQRGYPLTGIDPNLKKGILKHMPSSSLGLIKEHAAHKTQRNDPTLYLTPDLENLQIKEAYEHCEQFKWSYIDSNNKKRETDFKTLHANVLRNIKMSFVTCIPNKEKTVSLEDFIEAITVKWKAVVPELKKIENAKPFPVKNIQAKPYISDMLLMRNLTPEQREILLGRLTPEAEFHAILTGEIQLLDMHGENLGVAPEPNAAYDRFKMLKFSTSLDPSKEVNLAQLMLAHGEGKIPLDTLITFNEGGSIVSKSLKDLPELQEVFNGMWKFVIFDTDLSLSEDNRLLLQTRPGDTEFIIPLRSVLLETDWKDKPLSEETFLRLLRSDERDLRVRNWIQKEDAPIYKRLSPNVRDLIKKAIAPKIEQWTLGQLRIKYPAVTIKVLENTFVNILSDIDPSTTLKIWKGIEDDLSNLTVHPDDTWESIAERHRQNVTFLKQMNPEGLKVWGKVKIDYDLTSLSLEAKEKRTKIASQLFPRMTIRQQQALIARQTRRKDYLDNYMALRNSTFYGEDLFNQMERYILNPTSPFTSIRRNELLAPLNKDKQILLADPDKMDGFKQALCKECQPTYFNLMTAMYPLLADAYALNTEYYQDKVCAGHYIGLDTCKIIDSIDALKYQASRTERQERMLILAINLQKQITSIKDPGFLGHWGS